MMADMSHPKRWVTAQMAADELGVSKRTVLRWVQDTTEGIVPRKRMRLPDPRGRSRMTRVVELTALRAYSDTLN